MKLHAVDGFIPADVHVPAVSANLPRGWRGQGGETVCLRRGRHAGLSVLACFFERLLAPAAREHKVHGPALRQVHGHDGVFGQAATLHEQNLEVGGHGQQLAQVRFGLLVNADELFAPVAHLHDTHARGMPIQHLGCGLLQHSLRHDGGTRREVESAAHHLFRCGCAVVCRCIGIALGDIRVVFHNALQARQLGAFVQTDQGHALCGAAHFTDF